MKKNNKRLWFKITENRVEIRRGSSRCRTRVRFWVITNCYVSKTYRFYAPKTTVFTPKKAEKTTQDSLSWLSIHIVLATNFDCFSLQSWLSCPQNTLSQCPGLHFLLSAQSKSGLINVNFNIFRCQDFLPFRSVSASARDSVFLPEKQKSVTIFC